MADKPLMTGAKTVEQWVHAYLDEDTQNLSKKEKFIKKFNYKRRLHS